MSTPNLTAYQKRVAEYAAERGIDVSRTVMQGIAKGLHRRQARMSDVDLERVFMRADPTPPAAFRNIAANDRAAAQRLGLVAA